MNDAELDQLLKTFGPHAPAPAGFARDVWLRIEAAELRSWEPRARLLLERALACFALPPVAVATCFTMVVGGAWFGLQPARSAPSGELSYIQSVSPFAHPQR